jgi:hypothetical protein
MGRHGIESPHTVALARSEPADTICRRIICHIATLGAAGVPAEEA